MNLVETLNWRYACKKFDPVKKVKDDDIDFIKESIRLAASSFGLQLYKVLIITDDDLKTKLRPVSWNQSQITDCSHLFVFCHSTVISEKMVEDYARLRMEIQGKSEEETMKYINYMYGNVSTYDPAYFDFWSSKQTYIALSNLLTACGELKIDSCPIEGFDKAAYNEVLGLTDRDLSASVLAAVGYRAQDELNQHNAKVRRSTEELFENI